MKRTAGRLVLVGSVAAILIGGSRHMAERRRHLTLQPIGISTAAGITFNRCRQQATLRRRATLHPAPKSGRM